MLLIDRSKTMMQQSAANTATVTTAIGRQSGPYRILMTLNGDNMTVSKLAESAFETLIQPKILAIPWWPILTAELEEFLRIRFLFIKC